MKQIFDCKTGELTEVKLSAKDLQNNEAMKKEASEIHKKRDEEETKIKNDKKSGHDKLIELGLTKDQIFALTGFKEEDEE